MKEKKKILLLAQVPPPLHGQAVMQQFLVKQEWTWCIKRHVRLNFSGSIREVGSFSFSKVGKLIQVILSVRSSAKQHNIDLLYYPPAGPSRIPLYRDIIILLLVKKYTSKVILHFHAGGLCELIKKLTFIEKLFVKMAFSNISYAIVLLPWLKKELYWLDAKKIYVVPNGIKDVWVKYMQENKDSSEVINLLFVGNLKEEKGIFTLLEAVSMVVKKTEKIRVRVMGEAHSNQILDRINTFIQQKYLENYVSLIGTRSGEDKWREFGNAHIFCLPTYATEAMPVSILEAMMFSIPTITTEWRAIPDLIEDGKEGLLVPINDALKLSEKIIWLIQNPSIRKEIGHNARQKYLKYFTIETHLEKMQSVFKEVLNM